jgi:hypothetical protein
MAATEANFLVFMAIAMLITRTVGMAWRAGRVNRKQQPTDAGAVDPDHVWSTAS